jgi:hypothetical protein
MWCFQKHPQINYAKRMNRTTLTVTFWSHFLGNIPFYSKDIRPSEKDQSRGKQIVLYQHIPGEYHNNESVTFWTVLRQWHA